MIVFHRKYVKGLDSVMQKMVGFYSSLYKESGFSAVSNEHLRIIELNYRANACCENYILHPTLSDSSCFWV